MIAIQKRSIKIAQSNVQLTRSPVKEETLSLKPKLILLFSNTKDLRRIIQLSLEEIAGWQVFVADLDAQDLTLVTITQPDVILLDTNLPNSDELRILQKIRDYSDVQNIPIVLLTERIFNCDRKLYQSLGIAAAIAKPCDMVTLATIISQRLNWDWHRL